MYIYDYIFDRVVDPIAFFTMRYFDCKLDLSDCQQIVHVSHGLSSNLLVGYIRIYTYVRIHRISVGVVYFRKLIRCYGYSKVCATGALHRQSSL